MPCRVRVTVEIELDSACNPIGDLGIDERPGEGNRQLGARGPPIALQSQVKRVGYEAGEPGDRERFLPADGRGAVLVGANDDRYGGVLGTQDMLRHQEEQRMVPTDFVHQRLVSRRIARGGSERHGHSPDGVGERVVGDDLIQGATYSAGIDIELSRQLLQPELRAIELLYPHADVDRLIA